MKVMLVDGNSLTYRAFFALPTDITLASGQVTNAVYGFTAMLLNLVRDHKPDAIGVAFDRPEPTFRHERIDDYKAGRRPHRTSSVSRWGSCARWSRPCASRSSTRLASRPTTSSRRSRRRPATRVT